MLAASAPFPSQAETNIEAISQSKAARGTKRVCQACSARFYDLARDPIVCPACATVYVVAAPIVPREVRPVAPPNRSGWRNRALAQPVAVEPVPALDEEAEAVDAPDESVVPETDEIVLEEDTDDGALTELIDGPDQRDN